MFETESAGCRRFDDACPGRAADGPAGVDRRESRSPNTLIFQSVAPGREKGLPGLSRFGRYFAKSGNGIIGGKDCPCTKVMCEMNRLFTVSTISILPRMAPQGGEIPQPVAIRRFDKASRPD
jgi:hypothetical protein